MSKYDLLPCLQLIAAATTAVTSSLPWNQGLFLSVLSRASANQHPPFPTFPLCVCVYQQVVRAKSTWATRIHTAMKHSQCYVIKKTTVFLCHFRIKCFLVLQFFFYQCALQNQHEWTNVREQQQKKIFENPAMQSTVAKLYHNLDILR